MTRCRCSIFAILFILFVVISVGVSEAAEPTGKFEIKFNWIDYLFLGGYIAMILVMGALLFRGQEKVKDFALAGRSLGGLSGP